MTNSKTLFLIAVLGTLLILSCGKPPQLVYGCMDPQAINYNPNAEISSGKCEYKKVDFQPADFQKIFEQENDLKMDENKIGSPEVMKNIDKPQFSNNACDHYFGERNFKSLLAQDDGKLILQSNAQKAITDLRNFGQIRSIVWKVKSAKDEVDIRRGVTGINLILTPINQPVKLNLTITILKNGQLYEFSATENFEEAKMTQISFNTQLQCAFTGIVIEKPNDLQIAADIEKIKPFSIDLHQHAY